MGETIKDKHRPAVDFGAPAIARDGAVKMELSMAPEVPPPVQPQPPPKCPLWVPWAQHH
jgi:hypothetical protein